MVSTRSKRRLVVTALFSRLTADELAHVASFVEASSFRCFKIALGRDDRVSIIEEAIGDEVLLRTRVSKEECHGAAHSIPSDVDSDDGTETVLRIVRFETSLGYARRWLARLEARPCLRRASSILRHIVASAFPHGAAHANHFFGLDAEETLCVVSIAGLETARVVFVVTCSDQNRCEPGCWCSGYRYVRVHVLLPGSTIQLLCCGRPYGSLHFRTQDYYSNARRSQCRRTADALGIEPKDLGIVVRAVVRLTNIWLKGSEHWQMAQDVAMAGKTDTLYRHFPQKRPPTQRPVPGSPRNLLKVALPIIASRLTADAAASLRTLHHALAGWQQATRDLLAPLTCARIHELYILYDTPLSLCVQFLHNFVIST